MAEHEKSNEVLKGRMKKIAKELAKYYTVKVGILAKNNYQVSENMDLAGIGAVQEYGAKIKVTDKMRNFFRYQFGVNLKKDTTEIEIPARSWLLEPIKDKEFKNLVYEYFGDETFWEEYGDKKEAKDLANMIGNIALFQIQKAFSNGGINGEWKPNSPITITQKGSSMPLINNGNLRGQVAFEVE